MEQPTKKTTMADDIVDRLMTLFWTMKDAGQVQDKNTIADAIAEVERLRSAVSIVPAEYFDTPQKIGNLSNVIRQESNTSEIERLQTALHFAAGLLSTFEPYNRMHPAQILDFLTSEHTADG